MRKLLVALVVACGVFFTLSTPAEAAFQVKVVTPASGTIIIDDQGAGDAALGVFGVGTISFNIADSSYRLVGGITFHNSPGTAAFAILDINYNVSTVALNGNTFTGGPGSISVSVDGFTLPVPNPLTLTSKINGNGNGTGTISFEQFVDTNPNGVLHTVSGPTVTSAGLHGPFDLPDSYGETKTIQFNKGPTDYSITELINFDLDPDSNTSGDFQSVVTAAPAPAGLLLAIAAMPFGVVTWLRRRRTQS